jgi:hypothetical protein
MKICPKCGSTDIVRDSADMMGSMGVIPQAYVCNNCKTSAPVFPELENPQDLEKFKQDIEISNEELKDSEHKLSTVDTRYGSFVKWIWKWTGIFGIIGGVILSFIDPLFYLVIIAGAVQLLVVYNKEIKKAIFIE